MRVFLAGASGVAGRRLLPRLISEGHEVTAMTRTPAKAETLRTDGAQPVVCDALDPASLTAAVSNAHPDAVIHHLTDLSMLADPKLAANPRNMGKAWELNDRLRTEGTANLVKAAEAAGANRIVAQSIAFAYAPGPGLRTENDPLNDAAPAPFDKSVAALHALERSVLDGGPEGVVLRFGFWYGPGTGFASDGASAELVSKRRYPVVGKGSGVFSFVHIDDVVETTMAALANADPGVYNIVDDDPAPMREWLPVYADALGAKPPRKLPLWLARLFAGEFTAFMATSMPGVSNERAKSELGWTPKWASWRTGFQRALG